MKAIPVDARQRILTLYKQGKSTEEISEFFGFCAAAIRRVRQQYQERGTLEPRTHQCGRKTLFTPERQTLLKSLVAAQPDATLAELAQRMDRPFPTSTIDLWLHGLDLTFKKNGGRRRTGSSGRS